MDRKAMAEVLGVTPQSISNYENGKSTPTKLQINAWAVATGVDVEWLKTGKPQDDAPRGDGGPDDWSRLGDLNSRPSHYKVTPIHQSTRHPIAA